MQAGRGREGVGAGSKNHSRCLVKVNRREDFSIYFVIARGVREVWGSVGRRGVGAASRGRWQAGCAVVGAGAPSLRRGSALSRRAAWRGSSASQRARSTSRQRAHPPPSSGWARSPGGARTVCKRCACAMCMCVVCACVVCAARCVHVVRVAAGSKNHSRYSSGCIGEIPIAYISSSPGCEVGWGGMGRACVGSGGF